MTTAIADLIVKILAVAQERKLDFLGVADLSHAYEVADPQGRITVADRLPCAVSIGRRLDDAIVDDVLPSERYTQHFYRETWDPLRKTSAELAEVIRQAGWKVGGMGGLPGGGTKLAARLAGLGWIGKSSMVITPQCGPRVIWEAFATDAPLPISASKPMERRCGNCRRCVDICPVQAYKDVPFREEDPIHVRFNTGACMGFRNKLGAGRGTMGGRGGCALCVQICPYGGARNILLGRGPVTPWKEAVEPDRPGSVAKPTTVPHARVQRDVASDGEATTVSPAESPLKEVSP